MIRIATTFLAAAMLLGTNTTVQAQTAAQMSSPDGTLTANISLSDKGEICYDLSIDGQQIVTPS